MGLSQYSPDMDVTGVSAQDIASNIIDPRMLGEVDTSTSALAPITYMCVPFSICYNAIAGVFGASGTTGSKTLYTATALGYPNMKFEVIDVTIQTRAATTTGTIQIAMGTAGTSAVTDAIVAAVNNTITRAGSIDDTYSTFIPGTSFLALLATASSDVSTIAALVSIRCVKRP
jgi:hypothetical protein